ncbi:MAG: adenosylcobinamide-GDP ribazoletransferase [Haloarculaceae archaeon]
MSGPAGRDSDATAAADQSRERTAGPTDGTAERVARSLAGAVGFLTRIPAGADSRSWESFRRTPGAIVAVGYLAGALVAAPVWLAVALGVPAPTVALVLPAAVVAVTGINHADGLADLGDAAVVHGDHEARLAVLKDSAVGVGGTLALALLVAGLALAGWALSALPPLTAAGVVVAAEVSAKLGLATLACLGTAPHDGLGAQLTRVSSAADLPVPVLVAVPAAFATWPGTAAAGALVGGVAAALLTWRWAAGLVGGTSGDVFGATSELARLVALHAGVIAWTLS